MASHDEPRRRSPFRRRHRGRRLLVRNASGDCRDLARLAQERVRRLALGCNDAVPAGPCAVRRRRLLSRSRRQAGLFRVSSHERRWPALRRRRCRRRCPLRRNGRDPGPSGEDRTRGDARPQDQVLPQSDGAARHFAGAQEGQHGHGLPAGLRRPRHGRRQDRPCRARQAAVDRGALGSSGAEAHRPDRPGARHGAARRAARGDRGDALRRLHRQGRQRDDRRSRQEGRAAPHALFARDQRGGGPADRQSRLRRIAPTPREPQRFRRRDRRHGTHAQGASRHRLVGAARRHRARARRHRRHEGGSRRDAVQDRRHLDDVGVGGRCRSPRSAPSRSAKP